MVIESRTIVGAAAALIIVGGGLGVSLAVLKEPEQRATVEVKQLDERSWTVEVTELGAVEPVSMQTASR